MSEIRQLSGVIEKLFHNVTRDGDAWVKLKVIDKHHGMLNVCVFGNIVEKVQRCFEEGDMIEGPIKLLPSKDPKYPDSYKLLGFSQEFLDKIKDRKPGFKETFTRKYTVREHLEEGYELYRYKLMPCTHSDYPNQIKWLPPEFCFPFKHIEFDDDLFTIFYEEMGNWEGIEEVRGPVLPPELNAVWREAKKDKPSQQERREKFIRSGKFNSLGDLLGINRQETREKLEESSNQHISSRNLEEEFPDIPF